MQWWAVRICVLLLLGAIANVAVAVCAILSGIESDQRINAIEERVMREVIRTRLLLEKDVGYSEAVAAPAFHLCAMATRQETEAIALGGWPIQSVAYERRCYPGSRVVEECRP